MIFLPLRETFPSPALPAGWVQTPVSLSQSLSSGTSVTQTVSVTSASDAVANFYTVTETAVNAANSLLTASASATYSMQLPDTTAPTVKITSPLNGATVSGRINVSASAEDNVGVAKVEIAIDGIIKATDTSSPYTYRWNINKQTPTGVHTIQVMAYDAAGNKASDQISVTVK